MNPIVGLRLGGPVFLGDGAGAKLGQPKWGPSGLLHDLELRLGLPAAEDSSGVRLLAWLERIKGLDDVGAFYRRSLEVDELGTAAALLEWRDGLVEAGWDGLPVRDGGKRLDALAAIDQHRGPALPLGYGDRLARVARALAARPTALYDSIAFVEEPTLWARRWQDIFHRLASSGTRLTQLEVGLPGAPAASDLGILQARMRGRSGPAMIRGDGSLLLLQSDAPFDLAELAAAAIAGGPRSVKPIVIRCTEPSTLDAALARRGLPTQGCVGDSVWRPAMQVLPLAMELAFEPRDPLRALELLTLPVGPVGPILGSSLARAITRQPGIGGKEWMLQKTKAAERLRQISTDAQRAAGKNDVEAERAADALVQERLERLAAWLEGPAAPPSGATRAEVFRVVERVRAWLGARLRTGDLQTYGVAHAQVLAFAQALGRDARDLLSREDVRHMLDRFARSEQRCELSPELAGRVAHVNHPGAMLGPCDRVFAWGFVAGLDGRPARTPWNEEERTALEAAGVRLGDPAASLRAEADAWRRAVLAARERFFMFVPRSIKGTATAPHPLWDEIRARLGLDERGAARLTRDVRNLLDPSGERLVGVEERAPLRLPEPRAEWRVPEGALAHAHATTAEPQTMSVTALEKMAICPFAWLLEHHAGLRSGAVSRIAEGPLLRGALGHRLVEVLHAEGAFDLDEATFVTRTADRLEALLRIEAATLLLPGASVERLQVTHQMRHAMRELYRYLERAGFRIAGVEEVVTTTSVLGPLHGRVDLRLVDREGRPAILDLKWGASKYRALIVEGRAVQLAAYARALSESSGHESPPAGYFALSSGRPLAGDARMKAAQTLEGPSLDETWRNVQATAKAAMESVRRGRVPVAATRRALPLLEALGIPEAQRDGHFRAARDAACEHCDFDALCGKKWEVLS